MPVRRKTKHLRAFSRLSLSSRPAPCIPVETMTAPIFGSFPPLVPHPTPFSSALPNYLSPLGSVLDHIHATRERLDLPDPGKPEELGREAKSAFSLLPISLRIPASCDSPSPDDF